MAASIVDGEQQAGVIVQEAVSSLFIASFKMATFYGLYTWLTHTLFGVEVKFIPAVLASLLAAVPVVSCYWACIPGCIDLILRRQSLMAAILFVAHYTPTMFVDPLIYGEIHSSGHPYLLALSIVGGIAAIGLEGAIIGPMFLCVLVIGIDLYTHVLAPKYFASLITTTGRQQANNNNNTTNINSTAHDGSNNDAGRAGDQTPMNANMDEANINNELFHANHHHDARSHHQHDFGTTIMSPLTAQKAAIAMAAVVAACSSNASGNATRRFASARPAVSFGSQFASSSPYYRQNHNNNNNMPNIAASLPAVSSGRHVARNSNKNNIQPRIQSSFANDVSQSGLPLLSDGDDEADDDRRHRERNRNTGGLVYQQPAASSASAPTLISSTNVAISDDMRRRLFSPILADASHPDNQTANLPDNASVQPNPDNSEAVTLAPSTTGLPTASSTPLHD